MSIAGIKGMNDILPGEVETWQFLEKTAREVFRTYGFSEIRVPVVEKTELFCRSIGETTDIVEKEMYSFEDRSGNSISLRPEGTAPVMRALVQHKLYNLDSINKLYYSGPMFRYERPQKGRYRQFHQLGAEVVGVDDPKVDAQVLAMLDQFFQEAGIADVELQINSLGCPECRPAYRDLLVAYLEVRLESLCDDCKRRYRTNPLRALDCKSTGCKAATAEAPSVLAHLCCGCDTHFGKVRGYLDGMNIPYAVNDRMVRGLDYYTKTTFEMVTTRLGSQNAVAAGGRYDGLVKQIGGPALSGIGFAMGLERLALLKGDEAVVRDRPEIFLAGLGEAASDRSFLLMQELQRQGLRAEMDFEGRSLKSQMRRADKLGARYVLILGEDELSRGGAELRDMDAATQEDVQLDQLLSVMIERCGLVRRDKA